MWITFRDGWGFMGLYGWLVCQVFPGGASVTWQPATPISHRSLRYCHWKSWLPWLHTEISGVHGVPGTVMYDLNFAQRRRGCALLHSPWLGRERGESKMQMWSVEHEPVNLNGRLQTCGTALTIHPPKELEAKRVLEGGNRKVGWKRHRCHIIVP
jgi:hypothetical protein